MPPTELDGFILGLMRNTWDNDERETPAELSNQESISGDGSREKSLCWFSENMWVKSQQAQWGSAIDVLSAVRVRVLWLVSFCMCSCLETQIFATCLHLQHTYTLWWLMKIWGHQDGRYMRTHVAAVWVFAPLIVLTVITCFCCPGPHRPASLPVQALLFLFSVWLCVYQWMVPSC